MNFKKLLCIFAIVVIGFTAFGTGDIHQHDDPLIKTPFDNQKLWDDHYQKHLRLQPNWQQFLQNNGDWWVIFNEETGFPHRAMGEPIPMNGSGDLEHRAFDFLRSSFAEFNLPSTELYHVNTRNSRKYKYIDFKQKYKGLEILWSNAKLKLTQLDEVIMVGLDVYNDIDISVIPNIDLQSAITASRAGVPDITNVVPGTELKIISIPGYRSNEYKLVYEITVHTLNAENIPSKYYTLVDASNAEIIYRDNLVRHSCKEGEKHCDHKASVSTTIAPAATIDLNVSATVFPSHPYNASSVLGLPHLQVNVNGSNYYTDSTGYLGLNINGPVSSTLSLQGLYARVRTGQSGSVSPNFVSTLNNGQNNESFDAHTTQRHTTAYYHTNIVHDWAKRAFPTFTGLDFPLDVRVDRTDGSCNAFYNGSAINFYTTSNGCNALSLVADVVYHEYGHAINAEFYSQNGASFNNGAMGEGYADLIALSITQDPVLGIGFSSTNPNTSIRRYDVNPKVYPNDLVGQVHADGEIICGAWWDTGLLLGSHSQMVDLWTESFYATPTAPNGQEGQLYVDILIDALQADDDDGNINNGTPNIQDILDGFAIHGITLLSNADLLHSEVLNVSAGSPITIDASLSGVQFAWFLAGIKAFYKVNGMGSWTDVSLVNTGGNNYQINIPAQQEGSVVSYYLGLEDNAGNLSQVTPGKANAATEANIPFQVMVGFNLLITEDFDNFSGNWITGVPSDDNITGTWEIDAPIPSFMNPTSMTGLVAPGTQHTPGGLLCAFTENASSINSGIGESDVDAGNLNGRTTLVSPTYDLSSYTNPAFSYWRWYTNTQGATPGTDYWQVDISNDGSTWVEIENLRTDDHSWRRNVLRVNDFITPTSTVSLRFVAEDAPPGSIVEAAIDDLQLWNATETGISESDWVHQIMAYPNPASDQIHVSFFLKESAQAEIFVSDQTGRRVKQVENRTIAGGQHNVIIDLKEISSGLYFLNFVSEVGISVRKFTVVR